MTDKELYGWPPQWISQFSYHLRQPMKKQLNKLLDKYKPTIFFASDVPVVWISTHSRQRKGGVIRLQVNLTGYPFTEPEYTVNPNYAVKRREKYQGNVGTVVEEITTLLELLRTAEVSFAQGKNEYLTDQWAIVNMVEPTQKKKSFA